MTVTTPSARLVLRLSVAFVIAVLASQVGRAQEPQDRQHNRGKLLVERACDRCDLTGVDFSRENLKSVSASAANLESAIFYRADASGANFGGANLSKANLTLANLSNTNLGDANLAGANLTGATGAALAGAITTETTICPDGQTGPCR